MADFSGVRAAVEAGLREGIAPGCVVLVRRRGEVVLHKAFGFAKIEPEEVPMLEDSIFDVASLTKVVATTTALAILADEGRVDFDDPVVKHLPAFAAHGKECITLRQLATHSGGLTNEKFDALKSEAMIAAILERPTIFPPDTRSEYSCRGYITLGLVVEGISGLLLDEFCRRRIFEPLGMVDTCFWTRFDPAKVARRVFTERRDPLEVSDNQARAAGRAVGNAGLWTTAADLGRFGEAMRRGGALDGARILARAIVGRITRRMTPPGLERRGLGWDLRPYPESPSRGELLSKRAFGHTGWTGQALWVDPARELVSVILSNRTHPQPPGADEPVREMQGRINDAIVKPLEG